MVQKEDPPFRHKTFNPFVIPSDHRETDDRGPRQRADALGPPSLGKFDADLRRRLGENFKWLDTARLVGKSGKTLTLAILTEYQGEQSVGSVKPTFSPLPA